MAKKILASDIIDDNIFENAIKSAENLKDRLNGLKGVFEDNLKVTKNVLQQDVKTYEQLKKYNEAVKDSEASIIGVQKSKEALKKVEKAEQQLKQQLINSTDDEVKGRIRLQKAQKAQKDALRDLLVLEDKEAGTLERLAATNRKLRREREKLNLDTEKGVKRLREINAELDRNNEKIKESSDKLKQQKLNVGNYTDSVKDALNESGLFSEQIGKLNTIISVLRKLTVQNTTAQNADNAAKATGSRITKNLTAVTKVFNTTLKASPIFLLIGILTSVVAFLKKTQVGTELLSKGFAGINAVIDVFVDRISQVGAGLFDILRGNFSEGIDKITASFKGLGDELANEVAQATALEEQLIKIRKAEALLEAQRSLSRAQIKELNKIAEDTTESFEKRADAARKAIEIEQRLLNVQTETVKQRINNSLGEIEIGQKFEDVLALIQTEFTNVGDAAELANKIISQLGLSESTIDDLEAFTQEIVQLGTIQQESLELQTTLTNKLNIIEAQRLAQLAKMAELRKIDSENLAKQAAEDIIEADRMFGAIVEEGKDSLFSKQEENDIIASLDAKLEQSQSDLLEENNRLTEERIAKQQELRDSIQSTTQTVVNELNAQTEAQKNALEKEISQREQNIQTQQRLAENGLANTLAFEQQAKAAAEIERDRLAEKQQRREKTLAYFNLLASYAENNPDTAAAKALTQIAIAETVSAFFAEGTEKVGDDNTLKWRNTGKDDYVVAVDKNERIISAKQNELIGNISNKELAELAYNYRTGKLTHTFINNNGEVVSELRNLNQQFSRNQGYSIDWDSHDNRVERIVKNGMTRTIRHIKSRPRI